MQKRNCKLKTAVDREERFDFGENWTKYSTLIDPARIAEAEQSLVTMFQVSDLIGKSFLDVGCGSGIFSLAAKNLGAEVFSFDVDLNSVSCTRELKISHHKNDDNWKIKSGSVLDQEFIREVGQYDFVYCWGVAHHTGAMMKAFQNLSKLVNEGGQLFLAVYNDQGILSKYWTLVKRCYVKYRISRPLIILTHIFTLLLPSLVIRKIRGTNVPRGMSAWYDLIDWLGGFPFETSTVKNVFDFFQRKGFELKNINTVAGKMGCNEFVFFKPTTRMVLDD